MTNTFKTFDLKKNALAIIRVAKREYKNHDFIDIRQFYREPDNDEYKPTNRGITIPLNKIYELIDCLQNLAKELQIKVSGED